MSFLAYLFTHWNLEFDLEEGDAHVDRSPAAKHVQQSKETPFATNTNDCFYKSM